MMKITRIQERIYERDGGMRKWKRRGTKVLRKNVYERRNNGDERQRGKRVKRRWEREGRRRERRDS